MKREVSLFSKWRNNMVFVPNTKRLVVRLRYRIVTEPAGIPAGLLVRKTGKFLRVF